uniref:Uncharacterized protein n=1 Tax=Kalanchoe fedtschenkoi TaxID=63787 RepID=A0A7N0THC6_KALFE
MNEREFSHLLNLFPVVRSRDYNAAEFKPSTSQSSQKQLEEWQDAWDEDDGKKVESVEINLQDEFWKKLKSAAEKKVGRVDAERFCKAFQKVYKKTVFEELSLDAARSFLNSSKN